MKRIKLDENFPPSSVSYFTDHKFDATSVFHQQISGIDDDNLYQLCKKEKRILVTFDLDFANIIRYPSQDTKGIIVYRLRKKVTIADILAACSTIVEVLKNNETDRSLLVIEGRKLRIRKPE
jgi:predicted nuclease of predicted toxin-antitoxin system